MSQEALDLEQLAAQLRTRRAERCLPSSISRRAAEVVDASMALLFPHFSKEGGCEQVQVLRELAFLRDLLAELYTALAPHFPVPHSAVIDHFLGSFPTVLRALELDADAILAGDPAAHSRDEVILAYPGFYAIAVSRLAHVLHQSGFPLLPRLMTEYAHMKTGIDIHPGVEIGRGFFIDHGTGIVIGETAKIGNGVKIYQGVTLGAAVVQKELRSLKRHPTIEDHVVIYANATILGGDTVIGHDSVIGGNAWIVKSVPPFSYVGRDGIPRPRRVEGDDGLEFHI